MNRKQLMLFRLQYLLGRIFIIFTAPFVIILTKMVGYRIKDLKKVRSDIRAVFAEHEGPWIICPNHLTMIDSYILAYAMFPFYTYIFQYRYVPWNVPEKMNFNSNIFLALLCYLLKCIPVVRGGNRKMMKLSLSKCEYVLNKGESLMIFPEGTRSRTGRIDTENFSYGVGRFVAHIPDCRVMCIYMRGDKQKTYSGIPKFNDDFSLSIEICRPQSEHKGLKAQRDYSRQVIEKLAAMEKLYLNEPCR